jgi:Ring finger domain
MGSCCQCLFRFCCNTDDDRAGARAGLAIGTGGSAVLSTVGTDLLGDQHRLTPEERGLVVPNDSSSSSDATIATSADDDCCHRPLHHPHTQGLQDYFRRLGDRLRGTRDHPYDSVDNHRIPSKTEASGKVAFSSPLRLAESFDSISDIPCINASEVVFPGSELQKEMARLMASCKLTDAHEAECVICMEGFDPTNPRMPTLCGCGENKTYFHLPCLYQWIEHSEDCPSCREKLTWEEF